MPLCILVIKRFRYFCIVVGVLICALTAADAHANMLSSGVQVLQNIQGVWQRGCRQVSGYDGFVTERLKISYTHFQYTVSQYSDRRCINKVHESVHKIPFALRAQVKSRELKKLYTIAFDTKAETLPKLLRNVGLLGVRSGKLYIAPADAQSVDTILQRLPFKRHF